MQWISTYACYTIAFSYYIFVWTYVIQKCMVYVHSTVHTYWHNRNIRTFITIRIDNSTNLLSEKLYTNIYLLYEHLREFILKTVLTVHCVLSRCIRCWNTKPELYTMYSSSGTRSLTCSGGWASSTLWSCSPGPGSFLLDQFLLSWSKTFMLYAIWCTVKVKTTRLHFVFWTKFKLWKTVLLHCYHAT